MSDKKSMIRKTVDVFRMVFGLLLLAAWTFAGYYGSGPLRHFFPDRITGLCGVELGKEWNGEAWTQFLDFGKPLVVRDLSGKVTRVTISKKYEGESLFSIACLIEKRFGIDIKEVFDANGVMILERKYYRFYDWRSGNDIEVYLDESEYVDSIDNMSKKVPFVFIVATRHDYCECEDEKKIQAL